MHRINPNNKQGHQYGGFGFVPTNRLRFQYNHIHFQQKPMQGSEFFNQAECFPLGKCWDTLKGIQCNGDCGHEHVNNNPRFNVDCYYYKRGQCLKGIKCAFKHNLAQTGARQFKRKIEDNKSIEEIAVESMEKIATVARKSIDIIRGNDRPSRSTSPMTTPNKRKRTRSSSPMPSPMPSSEKRKRSNY